MGLFDFIRPARSAGALKPPDTKKVVVLGLDGAPYTLIRRLVGEGRLPHISRLLKAGSLSPMTTSLPDVSSVAWTSFMTGRNPGRHNVYGFMDRQDDSYDLYFPNSKSIQGGTLWDYLGKRGKRMVAINVPTTYPAPQVPGVLISGFVAIDFEKAVYPVSLLPFLKQMDYRIDVDLQLARSDPDRFFEDLFTTHDRRTEAILHFLDHEPWDLFTAVFTGTDRLQHFFWEHMEKGISPYGEEFLRFYDAVDESVGKIVERIGRDAHLILLSDHGFCLLEKEVYINTFLKKQGYLNFTKDSPESLADIDPKSQAYCLDPARIYINRKDTHPQGSVEPGTACEDLKNRLMQEFSALRDEENGEPMIQKVWTREELYDGDFSHRAPDLVLQPRYGYDLKGAVGRNTLTGRGALTGMHTYDDAMFYIRDYALNPPGEPRDGDPPRVSIFDLVPTILKLMGEEAPPDMDGKALI